MAWEEPNQLGSGFIRSRPLHVAKAWFRKVPTSENSSGEILELGRRLSYCLCVGGGSFIISGHNRAVLTKLVFRM